MIKRKQRPLVPKRLGLSLVSKGPVRDEKHLKRIRELLCVVCLRQDQYPRGATESHHCRHIAPRSMGRRVSDYLTIPLCWNHHLGPMGVHRENEAQWWSSHDINAAGWIERFSSQGAAEISRLRVNMKEQLQ